MSKKLQDLKWESVALEGFPASLKDNFQGFVGLEECTSYGLDKESKKPKKKKPEKKRKNEATEEKNVPNKKLKLSNGFIVETFDSIAPSLTNEENKNKKEKRNKNKREKNKKSKVPEPIITETKKKKAKLGDNVLDTPSLLTPEDMLTWAEFKLPETILKALAECGFKKPTNIQQLVLPAAIHGRRDILGAAETGSGKTLAFGLPILSGILKLKEKAAAGLDVYELPYKKTSAKKKVISEPVTDNKKKGNKNNKKQNAVVKKVEQKNKESSEDGYSSGEESNNEETDSENEEMESENDETDNENAETDNENEKTDSENEKTDNDNEEAQSADEETKSDENASNGNIEEIDVPLRKKEISADEGNDTDDSENYIHLSEMLDSDDLADSNDDDKDEEIFDDEAKSDENDEEEAGEVDENQEGIGCVKVIDDIEMPGQVMTKTGKPLYALILTPTRELAIQISRHLMAAAKYTGIRIATIVGGMAAVKQERVLRCGPEVVVATPGRLWELLNQGQPHLQQIDCIKFLAIDETDRMIERGHFDELTPLLERLNADETRRSSRQNFVFSATLTMVHDLPNHMRGKKVTKRGKILNRKVEKMTPQQKIKRLVDLIGMTEPKVVDITAQNLGTAETLTECRIACALEHKDSYLYYILKRHPGRTIVFCNSIGSVKRLAQLFTLLRCHPLPLHASMPQRQRLKNLERFRDDPHGVLVATDVAARGLDIPNVDHVIHYQVPRTAENYVHRSGRTARATKEGLTILMMEPSEAYLYSKLCRTLNKTAEIPTFPVAAQCLASLRDLVSFARDIDALELKKRRSAQALGWREKVAREMDIIVDDDNVPVKEADPGIEKALQVKRRQLNAMLSRPLIPRGFSFKYPTLNEPGALTWSHDDALQVMKKAIETGEVKKEKRKSKNAPLLKLSKVFNKKK